MPNGIANPSCADMDQLFRESREFYNNYYIKKMAVNSAYYSRVQIQTWPEATLPEQSAFRFGRGWYNPDEPWYDVNSGRCVQDSCDNNWEFIAHPGTEKYTFRLFRKDMRTDWYCLTDLNYRLFGEAEMNHIMDTNVNITKNVHEEFARSNWVGGSGHRWLPIAGDDTLVSCTVQDDTGWFVKEFDGTGEGSYDVGYVYVKLPATQLDTIGLLSLDTLDDVLVNLQREDDAYRLDVSEWAGRPLLEIIVPDAKVLRQIWQFAKQSGGWWEADTDFDNKQLQYSLGIERVVGNYAFAYDINGLRFNVDWAYNNALSAFNEADPDTWPRLKRVLPYYPVAGELGCKWVQNPLFTRADFGITVPWINNQMIKWMAPNQSSYGEATGAVQNYAGDWEWKNPDWECNIKRNQGFFWNQFRMGMQIQDPSMVHSILHRLNNSQIITPACCPLQADYTPQYTPDCYACTGVVSENP